jgi:hypothetical protein
MAGVSDEVTAIARIRNRRLFIEDRRRFDEAVSNLDERWDYEIAVRRLHANRSQQFNRYYWAVVVELLSEHTGYTPDEVHDLLKMRFIPKRLSLADDNGEIKGEFVLGGSTRKMSTEEFGKYIETIREWAAIELGVIIPDPDGGLLPVASAGGHGWGV